MYFIDARWRIPCFVSLNFFFKFSKLLRNQYYNIFGAVFYIRKWSILPRLLYSQIIKDIFNFLIWIFSIKNLSCSYGIFNFFNIFLRYPNSFIIFSLYWIISNIKCKCQHVARIVFFILWPKISTVNLWYDNYHIEYFAYINNQ